MRSKIYFLRLLAFAAVLAICGLPPHSPDTSANSSNVMTEIKTDSAIIIRNLEKHGSFEVENSSGNEVELSWQIAVERKEGDEWKRLTSVTELNLIEKCGMSKDSSCMRLAGGAKISPVPWTGWAYRAQCRKNSRKDRYYGPGTFRFIVKSCDGKQEYYGPEFEMPKTPTSPRKQ